MQAAAASTNGTPLTIEQSFARLQLALNSNPGSFAAVGGDVEFYVRGAKTPYWQVVLIGSSALIKPGKPPFPVCTIGIVVEALQWLALGTLDVARAFKTKRLAVEGDLEALGRFVTCFAVN